MKRILMNDQLLAGPRTGVGQYLASVLAHWPRDAQLELVGYYFQRLIRRERPPADAFVFPNLDAIPRITLKPLALLDHSRPSWMRRMWTWLKPFREHLYPRLMRGEFQVGGYSGFFEPNHLVHGDLQPAVAVMLDLSVLEVPQFHPADRVAHWARWIRRGVKWTRHWICISQATADAMVRVLGVPRERMTVIPLASRWGAPPENWSPSAVRQTVGLPDRYLVCLGTIEPRKNLIRLLDAYAVADATWRDHTPLLLAGMPGWGQPEFWDSLRNHPMARHVLMTGRLTDAQTAAVVRGALGLVYPSLYEGFGLPPLEAMALGVPVAASTADSVREVCGDAAPCIDPNDTSEWAEWMQRLTCEGAERDRLIEKGGLRNRDFCWKKTAQQHHDLLARMAA